MAVLDSADPQRLRHTVACRLGLQFDDTKLALLEEVLRRRVEATGQPTDRYFERLEHECPSDELGALAQELTVPETHFFRHMDQFRAFAEVTLPERMRAQVLTRSLRFLSAGCASGEEAYSLAIMIHEAVPDPSWNVSIRAVDVSPAVVKRAVAARYSRWALRETPLAVQRKWFRPEGADLVLLDPVRAAVQFTTRNLASEDPELWQPGYDAIFCRNVLMYFTREHAEALVARLARSLAPGGYLFLGHAETLRGLSQQFHLCHTHGTFYYQQRAGADVAARAHDPDVSMPPLPGRELAAVVESAESWVDAIQRAAERIQALTRAPIVPASFDAATVPRWNLRLALDCLRMERFEEALDQVNRLPPESQRDPDVLLLHALLLAHRGDLAAAEPVCQRLLEIDELNAGAHYVLALCREASGDRQAAEDHDQVAVYLDPLFAMPRLHLGLLARRAGDRDAARHALGQALILFQREDPTRLLLFGGGFDRETLIALCQAELDACGGRM